MRRVLHCMKHKSLKPQMPHDVKEATNSHPFLGARLTQTTRSMTNVKQKVNQQIVSSSMVNRQFSYSKGRTNLSFQLRIDIKTELREFIELLEQALKDVTEEFYKKE